MEITTEAILGAEEGTLSFSVVSSAVEMFPGLGIQAVPKVSLEQRGTEVGQERSAAQSLLVKPSHAAVGAEWWFVFHIWKSERNISTCSGADVFPRTGILVNSLHMNFRCRSLISLYGKMSAICSFGRVRILAVVPRPLGAVEACVQW